MRVIKYIMIDKDTPVLFPDHLQHRDVASRMCRDFTSITSAGFVSLNGRDECGNTLLEAYGKSVSLGVESDEKDSAVMNRVFGLTYSY